MKHLNRSGLVIAAIAVARAAWAQPLEIAWNHLEHGLDLGSLASTLDSGGQPPSIHILRIDPSRFELTLLNASAPGQGRMWSARQWCERESLVAAINSSMYQTDYRTSVSFMRTAQHVNNGHVSKDKTILAFDRVSDRFAPVKLLDRECDDFQIWKTRYRTFVQSIRMISCTGRNVWGSHQPRWSVAAVALDIKGNVLFVHCEYPHTVYDIANSLKQSAAGVDRAMYVEGGSEAQLCVASRARVFEFVGQYTGGGKPSAPSSLPNVIGVRRR